MERTEPGASLGHHVQTEPGAIGFPILIPVFEFVFTHALDSLRQTAGHGHCKLINQFVYFLVEQ